MQYRLNLLIYSRRDWSGLVVLIVDEYGLNEKLVLTRSNYLLWKILACRSVQNVFNWYLSYAAQA